MDCGLIKQLLSSKAALIKSGGIAHPSTHFYLPISNLEQSGLPKQSIPHSFHSKPMVLCRSPQHCKSFSLVGNTQPPLSLANSLLSFPLHRLTSSHLLPLISTRSHFSDPNVGCVSQNLCCQGLEGAPGQPSVENCAAAAFCINPWALIPGSPWGVVSICSSAQLPCSGPQKAFRKTS